jgi:hypothetical protein
MQEDVNQPMMKELWSTKDIVKHMTSDIHFREDILEVGYDRGLGEGMQIENWILIEMASKLLQLKNAGFIADAEEGHKYPNKKSSRYEHCDLWWHINREEHWLEVKSIVFSKDGVRGSKSDIFIDLDKKFRLRSTDIFHHLAIVFPIEKLEFGKCKDDLLHFYTEGGLKYEADWNYDIGSGKTLFFILFSG